VYSSVKGLVPRSTVGKWWNFQGSEGLVKGDGRWRSTLTGEWMYSPGLFPSLFHFLDHVSFVAWGQAKPAMMFCLIRCPKTMESISHGLKSPKLWAKTNLFPLWADISGICYHDGKLTSTPSSGKPSHASWAKLSSRRDLPSYVTTSRAHLGSVCLLVHKAYQLLNKQKPYLIVASIFLLIVNIFISTDFFNLYIIFVALTHFSVFFLTCNHYWYTTDNNHILW
jgi:hypothetical protein